MRPYGYIFVTFLFVVTGCLSEKKIARIYFTLEIPAGQPAASADTAFRITGNCEVEQVVVNMIYDKNQIVNRAGANEISYYVYNQWAVRPSDAITGMVKEYLETAGIFQRTSDRYSRTVPDFRFRTFVNSLEMIETRKTSTAHLNLEFSLINYSDGSVIVSHMADRENELKANDLNMFSGEISRMFMEELNKFAGMIIDKRTMLTAKPR
jgi:ABC-type uncharacterized transport system auxiliary subunit